MDSAHLNSYLLMVARRLDKLTDRAEIAAMLDELEYRYEALDPEYQEPVAQLIERLHKKLRLGQL